MPLLREGSHGFGLTLDELIRFFRLARTGKSSKVLPDPDNSGWEGTICRFIPLRR